MQLNLGSLPYHSVRQPVFATGGMVATSQPLAAQAGLAALKRGGNAVDAAIATAAALAVVEPASCGVGGDCFALVWDKQQLHGLNGSGRAPAAISAEMLRQRGQSSMPSSGWLSTTVPGAPMAWRDLHQRFGKLPFASLLEEAIAYAEHGHPVSPTSAHNWEAAFQRFKLTLSAAEFGRWAASFAPDGRPPKIGEIWRCPDLAASLRQIGATGAEAFYRGELAEAIAACAASSGGLIGAADLAQHASSWVEPISTSYRGFDVWEIPPNGQGLAALIALNILENFDLASMPRDSEASYHLQIEAMKLAFADAQRYIADPERAAVPTQELLSKRYAAERAKLIGQRALDPAPGEPHKSGTAYLCTADSNGMMVSLIQSVYSSFGSGITIPGTGIVLQNRGAGFTLEAGHPNLLEPGKRPFHTIIPGFLTRGGQAIGPFGVKGGHMQPQGHLQMIVNTIDYALSPQASLDAPRWFWSSGRAIKIEPQSGAALAEALAKRGHAAEIDADYDSYGCGQIIWRLPSGVYVAGSEGRTDGCALGF